MEGRQLVFSHRRRRHFWRLILLILFLLVFIGGLIYAVFFSGFFKIKKIIVAGNRSIPSAEILKLTDAAFIFQPVHLKNLPLSIREIDVSKKYLSREVILDIKERDKYAVWCGAVSASSTPSCFWFDEDGIAFLPAPLSDGSFVKVVKSNHLVNVGDSVLEPRLLSNLIKIFSLVVDNNLPVSEFKIDDIANEELAARVTSGPLIYFSLRLDPSFAFKAIFSLRDDFPKLDYLDLRSANRAFYKYK